MKSIIKQHVITVLCSLAFVPTVMGKKSLSPEGQARYDKAIQAMTKGAKTTYDVCLKGFNDKYSPEIAKLKALLATIADVERRTNEKSSIYRKARRQLSIYNEELKQYRKTYARYLEHLEACSNDGMTRGNKYTQRDTQEKIDLCAKKIKEREEWKKPLILQCVLYKPESQYYQEVKNTLARLFLETGLMTQDSDTYLQGNLSRQNLVAHVHQKSPSAPAKKMISLVMQFYHEIKALERSQSVPNFPVVEHERPLRHSKSFEEDKWVQDTDLPVGLFSDQQPDHVEVPQPQYPD